MISAPAARRGDDEHVLGVAQDRVVEEDEEEHRAERQLYKKGRAGTMSGRRGRARLPSEVGGEGARAEGRRAAAHELLAQDLPRVRVGLLRRRRHDRGVRHEAGRRAPPAAAASAKGRQSGRADARTGRAPRASRAAGGAASRPVAPAAADSTRIRFSICRGADEMTFSISSRRRRGATTLRRPLRGVGVRDPLRARARARRCGFRSILQFTWRLAHAHVRSPGPPSRRRSRRPPRPPRPPPPPRRSPGRRPRRAPRASTDARRIVAG